MNRVSENFWITLFPMKLPIKKWQLTSLRQLLAFLTLFRIINPNEKLIFFIFVLDSITVIF